MKSTSCFSSRLLIMMSKQNIHVSLYISIIILYIFFLGLSHIYYIHIMYMKRLVQTSLNWSLVGFNFFSPPVETGDCLSPKMAETETAGLVYLWFCRVWFWSGSQSLKLDFNTLLTDLRPHERHIADAVLITPLWHCVLKERPWKRDHSPRPIQCVSSACKWGKINLAFAVPKLANPL